MEGLIDRSPRKQGVVNRDGICVHRPPLVIVLQGRNIRVGRGDDVSAPRNRANETFRVGETFFLLFSPSFLCFRCLKKFFFLSFFCFQICLVFVKRLKFEIVERKIGIAIVDVEEWWWRSVYLIKETDLRWVYNTCI